MRKGKVTLVEQDKTLLARRDTKTNILFTWECSPDSPIKAWLPGEQDSVDFDPQEMMNQHFGALHRDEGVPVDQYFVAGWASAIGAFDAYVEHFLEHFNRQED